MKVRIQYRTFALDFLNNTMENLLSEVLHRRPNAII